MKPARDHEGREFPSTTAMCRHWGVDYGTFKDRVERGVPLGDALTARARGYEGPDGKAYGSFTAMCHAYGKSHRTVQYRVRHGMDLLSALRRP